MSRIVAADELGIAQAVEALRRGGVIGLPTETVYGLAADATNDEALRRVFAVKDRPATHPLIVHVADAPQLDALALEVSDSCRVLTTHAWPGPLTVIVHANDTVSRVATGGRDTVAVRVPAHRAALAIITQLGRPLAAPSANRFGEVSPTSARHVADDLGDDVDVIVDGGDCAVGVESTIVDCTTPQPEILRPGAITAEDIALLLDPHGVALASEPTGESRAPGMLARHYAPKARLHLVEPGSPLPRATAPVLDCSHDLASVARTLYGSLRDLDQRGVQEVNVLLPPPRGLGHAIRDRLQKAAFPARVGSLNRGGPTPPHS